MITPRPRLATERLRRLEARFPAVAVLGARQVRKSTLLAQTLGWQVPVFVFDSVLDVANVRRDPEVFLRLPRRSWSSMRCSPFPSFSDP